MASTTRKTASSIWEVDPVTWYREAGFKEYAESRERMFRSSERGSASRKRTLGIKLKNDPRPITLAHPKIPENIIPRGVPKDSGRVKKHEIVAEKVIPQGTLGWDPAPLEGLPGRYKPSWKEHLPETGNTQPEEPLNEHEEITLIGPNLPIRFPPKPIGDRIYPPRRRRKQSPPPQLGDYPRPATPSSHWEDREQWPKDTSELPFTIPLSSIDQLAGLKNSKVQERCALDDRPYWGRCVMCRNESNGRWKCLQCGEAWYCSKDCLDDDEHTHKLICDAFAPNGRFTELWRQSQDHHRALVWPAKSNRPELRWVHIHHSSERLNPLDSDPSSNSEHDDDDGAPIRSPSLLFTDPEFWSFASSLPKSSFADRMFRIGCINQARAFAQRPLGNGLFILEWALPPTTDLLPSWANQSIASLSHPGHIWYYPGPIMIIALDVTRPTLTLRDITPRDVRHAIDYFRLNTRNPVLTDPTLRFPMSQRVIGLKLADTAQPMASGMGIPIEPTITEIVAAASLPFANEGLSALCHRLGLSWIFRDAICHSTEFDWLYDRDKSEDGKGKGKGTVLSGAFRGIYPAPEDIKKDSTLKLSSLMESGDGIVVLHRTGNKMYPHHLRALIEYIGWRSPVRMRRSERAKKVENLKDKLANGRAGFERFWSYYYHKERLGEGKYIPSPYQLEEKYAENKTLVGKEIMLALAMAQATARDASKGAKSKAQKTSSTAKGKSSVPKDPSAQNQKSPTLPKHSPSPSCGLKVNSLTTPPPKDPLFIDTGFTKRVFFLTGTQASCDIITGRFPGYKPCLFFTEASHGVITAFFSSPSAIFIPPGTLFPIPFVTAFIPPGAIFIPSGTVLTTMPTVFPAATIPISPFETPPCRTSHSSGAVSLDTRKSVTDAKSVRLDTEN
ncbi:hypothetical protein B0T16DRAFT_502923 [Cercophora newfieldiana]|uniref:MYND-type domain-containing protein n=1 Tax=Cercophora newfieldiana TaxID=92897 RepID=A0AA40D076_9PEZI|nr:hypothetical protein B0T16DRAFT_502923 [Cercophora newfieldiana]